jgi:hypothetical protein
VYGGSKRFLAYNRVKKMDLVLGRGKSCFATEVTLLPVHSSSARLYCFWQGRSGLFDGTRAYAQPGGVNRRLMIYAAMIALLLIPSTRIVQLPDTEIVRRGNFVIAGTVDGFLCYGTKVPRSVKCHRAVELTQIGESGMPPGQRDQSEDLPKKQPISR